ncbi:MULTISPECIES: hypothetical protein [Providencia]|uniref:Uncharacterized protein n=1 Tax=Providencia stuartii TaxID=588 RepID=A0A1S1HVI8_PROST|nr:hypothetical protein [Providencia stuartii]OHT25997.1 hypothetical protein A3Q29_01265 [Providencia stuartii]
MTTSISNHNKLAVYSSQLGQISKKNTEEAKASIVNSINNASNSPIEKPQVEAAKQGKAHYSDISNLHKNINELKELVANYKFNQSYKGPSFNHKPTTSLADLRQKIDDLVINTGNYALRIAGNETKAQLSKAEKLRSEINEIKKLNNSVSEVEDINAYQKYQSDNYHQSKTQSYDSKRAQQNEGRYQD